MVRQYALRDDQWERIKDLLPGREDTAGARAQDNRLFVEAVLYRYRTSVPGAMCRSGLATGRTFTAATEGGLKAVFGRRFSNIWRRMPTTNTR